MEKILLITLSPLFRVKNKNLARNIVALKATRQSATNKKVTLSITAVLLC
jgi:hypothetical protein